MIEADGRRPSRRLAERLVVILDLPIPLRLDFIRAASAEQALDRLPPPDQLPASSGEHQAPSGLPLATITFLCCDIDPYLHCGMAPAPAEDAIPPDWISLVEHCITAAGGVAFDLSHGVLCAAFRSPLDVATVALAVQRAVVVDDPRATRYFSIP